MSSMGSHWLTLDRPSIERGVVPAKEAKRGEAKRSGRREGTATIERFHDQCGSEPDVTIRSCR